jgi:hypothetical protein
MNPRNVGLHIKSLFPWSSSPKYEVYGNVDPRYEHITYAHTQINQHTLGDNLSLLFPASKKTFPRAFAQKTLGTLSTLPVELLHEALAQLDVRTLVDFRYVNRRAAEVVNALPDYKLIAKHAPNTLRGILIVGAGRSTTCKDISDALCMEECNVCGELGGYLYLPTCKRVCWICWVAADVFQPLARPHAQRQFGLNEETLNGLTHIKIMPGSYSVHQIELDTTIQFDYEEALEAAIAQHGSWEALNVYKANLSPRAPGVYDYMDAVAAVEEAGHSTDHLQEPATYPRDTKVDGAIW